MSCFDTFYHFAGFLADRYLHEHKTIVIEAIDQNVVDLVFNLYCLFARNQTHHMDDVRTLVFLTGQVVSFAFQALIVHRQYLELIADVEVFSEHLAQSSQCDIGFFKVVIGVYYQLFVVGIRTNSESIRLSQFFRV